MERPCAKGAQTDRLMECGRIGVVGSVRLISKTGSSTDSFSVVSVGKAVFTTEGYGGTRRSAENGSGLQGGMCAAAGAFGSRAMSKNGADALKKFFADGAGGGVRARRICVSPLFYGGQTHLGGGREPRKIISKKLDTPIDTVSPVLVSYPVKAQRRFRECEADGGKRRSEARRRCGSGNSWDEERRAGTKTTQSGWVPKKVKEK